MTSLRLLGAWALAGRLAPVFWSTPAAADYYGAIAFSQGSGAYGYSADFDTRAGAEERALQGWTTGPRPCRTTAI